MQDLAALRRAAEQTPDNAEAWITLCGAAEAQKNYAEVLYTGDRLATLIPHLAQPHFIRGLALYNLDQLEESAVAYRAAVARDPRNVDAWTNLGHVCQALNLIDEAAQAYRQSIDISGQSLPDEELFSDRDLGNHHWNLAIIELLKGDLKSGFARYPARTVAIPGALKPDFSHPRWQGEDLNGKTILVTVTQGHGDTLMMARYLPLLRQRGARVLFQVQPALASYFNGWNGADQIVGWDPATLPAFDYYASEFDLPRLFGTTLDTMPANVPYLPIPAPDATTRLPQTGKKKIAVTWAGFFGHLNDKNRSLSLAELAPLFALPDIDFYALNRDKRDGDDALLKSHGVTDLSLKLTDFAATASYLTQMDLLITCDTAIAHLAGGMGKPVWIMLPFAPDWRWLINRTDSPWYPTAQLFRQQSRGNWASVSQQIKTVL